MYTNTDKNIKYCGVCNQYLRIDDFSKCLSRKDGLQTKCKACNKEYQKKYYNKNIEKEREKRRRYYDDNKQAICELRRIKYKENRDRLLQAQRLRRSRNKEKERLRATIKYYKNRAQYKLRKLARKNKIKPAYLCLTSVEKYFMERIYQRARELEIQTGIKMHVDHIVPISKGGLHHPWNLQILSADDNLAKSTQTGWQHKAWPLHDDAYYDDF